MKKSSLILSAILMMLVSSCDIKIGINKPSSSSISSGNNVTSSIISNNNTNSFVSSIVGEKGNTANFFFINDNHGRLIDDNLNGFSRISSALNKATSDYGEHIKIANGDIFQGTYISNTYYGKPMVDCLNYLNFDAFVIGNHEFDWGLDKIARYKDGDESNGEANFDFLGANIVYKSNNKSPDWIKPYKITYNNNRKVGIVGVIGKLENSINQAMLTDYTFLDPVTIAKENIKKLRTEEKCDSVIVSIHDFDTDYKSITSQFGELTGDYLVDALLCAHTHEKINSHYTRSNKTEMPYVQNGGNNNCSTSLRLTYDNNDVVTSYSVNQYTTSSMSVDSDIHNDVIADYEILNKEAENRVLGTTSSSLNKDKLGIIATDAMVEFYNTDLSVMNTGGVRATIPAGDITYKQVFECFPFDNVVYTFELSGSKLKSFLNEASGFMYYNSTFKSSSVSTSKTYKVAMIDYVFTSTYYQDILKDVNYVENAILRDIVVDYIDRKY